MRYFAAFGFLAVFIAAPALALDLVRDGRTPFEVDVTGAVVPGENAIAVRVDHTKMTELYLGGIIRPVLLIEKGAK